MTIKLSACLIVRNEADVLPRCLASLAGVADEIVAVDTGSTDGSIAILKEAGARVVEIVWPDDFAAARNVAVDHARGEWILFLDADEALDARTAAHLQHLLVDVGKPISYDVPLRHYVTEAGEAGPYNLGWMVRLFNRVPGHRYEGRVHETIVGSDPVRLDPSALVIDHWGFLPSRIAAKRKVERNEALLRRVEAEQGETAESQVYLANQSSDPATALGHAERALELLKQQPDSRNLPHLAANRILAVLNLAGAAQDALDRAGRLRDEWPSLADDPEHWSEVGSAHLALGQRDDAAKALLTVCRLLQAPRSVQVHKSEALDGITVNRLVALLPPSAEEGRPSLRGTLADLASQAPDHRLVRLLAAAVVRAHPQLRVAITNDLLAAKALVAAMETMQPQLAQSALKAHTLDLAGAHLGQRTAMDLVAWYLQLHPEDAEARHHLARHQVALGLEDDARQSIVEAYGMEGRDMRVEMLLADMLGDCGKPDEADVHLKFLLAGAAEAGWSEWCVRILLRLGQLAFQRQSWGEAERHLSQALAIQPDHAELHYTQGCTQAALGNLPAARGHFERALALDPHFAPAREALQDLAALADRPD